MIPLVFSFEEAMFYLVKGIPVSAKDHRGFKKTCKNKKQARRFYKFNKN